MLPSSPVALYTRKSSVEDSKQVASHDQQRAAILAHHDVPEYFPGTTISAWWKDSGTGSSFETRPGIMGFLTNVAERYPQPPDAPGRLFIYDESRFSRALKDGKADLHASVEMQIRFARLGWQIVFISRPPTGNAVMDTIMDTLAFAQASDYLVKLTASVKRGKADWGQKGYWLGGPPPYPARRVEAETRRPLADGVRATERTVLEPDPTKVGHWNHGAGMLLAGHSIMGVVRYFAEHVPTASRMRRGKPTRWVYSTVRQMYSNRALIGELEYRLSDEPVMVRAKWPPIVDVELFRQVNAEIARREQPRSRRAGRRFGSAFPLQAVRCAACGTGYKGTTNGNIRYYVHYQPAEPYMRGEALARARTAGCRSFTVRADELEEQAKDAIARLRCDGPAAVGVLATYAARRGRASEGANRITMLREDEARREGEYENLREALRTVRDADLRKDLIADAGEVRAGLERLRFELHAALSREAATAGAEDAIRRTIDESARVAAEWPNVGFNERQALFDQWVEDLLIEIDHEPGRRWPTAKRAIIRLAEVPNELHQRHRADGEIPEASITKRRRKHLARGASNCEDSVVGPRSGSSRARGCPRG